MISSLQKILQKHHKWLFSILLAVITVSFVFTVGSSPGIGRNVRDSGRKFFGVHLNSRKEVLPWIQEVEMNAQLRQLFMMRFVPNLEDFALFARLATLHMADELAIPDPTKTQLSTFVETYPAFRNEAGQFDPNRYNRFLESLEKDSFQKGIFEKMLLDDFRCSLVEKALSAPAFISPAEVLYSLQRKNTKYTFSIANFHNDIGPKSIVASDEELNQFYKEHQEDYVLGEQMVLDYLEFPNENFLTEIPELSQNELRKFYLQNKEAFPDLREDSENFESIIRQAYEKQEAQMLAMQAADQFISNLYEKNVDWDSAEFQQLIDEQKLKKFQLEPIFVASTSNHPLFSPEDLAQGEKLNETRYYSDPVLSRKDTVCILIYRDRIPRLYQPFESVKEQVLADYQTQRAQDLFDEKVEHIFDELIKSPHDQFTAIAKKAGATLEHFDKKLLQELTLSKEQIEVLHTLKPDSFSKILKRGEADYSILYLKEAETPEHFENTEIQKEQKLLEQQNHGTFAEYVLEAILKGFAIDLKNKEAVDEYRMLAKFYFQSMNNLSLKF